MRQKTKNIKAENMKCSQLREIIDCWRSMMIVKGTMIAEASVLPDARMPEQKKRSALIFESNRAIMKLKMCIFIHRKFRHRLPSICYRWNRCPWLQWRQLLKEATALSCGDVGICITTRILIARFNWFSDCQSTFINSCFYAELFNSSFLQYNAELARRCTPIR